MRRSVLIPVGIVLAVILIIGVGGYLLYNNYYYYSTDDAQVTGNIVNVVAPTSGTLVGLDVQVGDFVSNGQIIGTVKSDTNVYIEEHIKAPFDGVIVQVPGVLGQTITSQGTVAQESNLSTVKITAYVDESAINNVSVGQSTDIHVDAYSGFDLKGHVTQIVDAAAGQFSLLPTQDNSSGNFTKVSQRIPVYIHLDNDPGQTLVPGMSVEVKIHIH
jgi:multidrug resistance efflux pump